HLCDRFEIGKRPEQEPAQPHALAPALIANAVHTVIPVSAENERQSAGTAAPDGKIERPRAMLIQRRALAGGFGQEEGVMLMIAEFLALDERQLLVEDFP